jgi:hypothetical protein
VGEWRSMRRHTTVNINGPVLPGNVYCVVIRSSNRSTDTIRSIRASLPLCMAKARQFNKTHRQDLAHVEYVGEEKKE